ncbi:MAG: hypothetical protein IJ705_04830 [Oscillospiraceae bacterium]|nr:hypothetical protein [Oscillospiraceae bacterium]
MENNKKTREPLDDDALGEVAGGGGVPDFPEPTFEEAPAPSYKKASAPWNYKKKP